MDAELLLYAVCTFVVAVLGGLVGLVLGNLRLPVTLLFASSAAAGAGTNIAVSAVAATTASVGHLRAGRVEWGLVGWMIPPTIVAGFAGGYLAGRLAEQVLLGLIAVVLVYSAFEVLRPPSASAVGGGRRRAARAATVSAVIGFAGGVVGLILGSLRLPALIRVVGQRAHEAVGTNQVVGAALGYAGVAGHLAGSGVDPALVAAGALGAAPGGIIGAHLTGVLSESWLRRGIAIALLASAAGITVRLALG
jgi:uncharacterized membrane protein YfcA